MTPAPEAPPPPAPPPAPAANGGGAPANGSHGVAGWILKDWPLKLFALVLAFMIWVVVREQITTTLTVTDIPVEIEIREGYVVLASTATKVSVTLQGPWGDVAPARSALLASGGRVRLRLNKNIDGDAGASLKGNPEDYTFPFEQASVVVSVTPPLNVEWARLAERTVVVATPPPFHIPADANIEAIPAAAVLDVKQVRVRGPALLVESLKTLPLDPIAVGPWWDTHPDLSTPMAWEAGFDAWRSEVPAEASLRNAKVLTLTPERVTGRAKFRQTAMRALAHALKPIPPAGADTYVYSIERSREYDPRTGTLQVNVKGDSKSLDFLEKSPDEWTYFVELPPPLGADGKPLENAEVPVFLRIRKPGVRADLDGSPTVLVSVKPR